MRVIGRLVSKETVESQINDYCRIFVATELGYDVEIQKITIFDKKAIEQLSHISAGRDVVVDGYSSITGFRNGTNIEMINITPCSLCLAPLDDTQDAQELCQGCFHTPQENISGVWTLKMSQPLTRDDDVNPKKLAIKLILKQEENVLGYVTFPQTPFYNVLSILKEGDRVCLQGWRDEKRHTKLTNAAVLIKPTLRSNEANNNECVECGKEFKNKNSLNTHRSFYHKKM